MDQTKVCVGIASGGALVHFARTMRDMGQKR